MRRWEVLLIAFDTETHRIQGGDLAPPLVCLSLAWDGPAPSWLPPAGPEVEVHEDAALLAWPAVTEDLVRALLEEGLIVGANVAYDFAVLARTFPALLPAIFAAYEQGRVSDVQIRERLIANAAGRLASARTSLGSLAATYLAPERAAAMAAEKAGGGWRLRYEELEDLPLAAWPAEARAYPLEDARATLDVHREQGRGPADVGGFALRVDGRIVSEDREARAAWALHLAAVRGLRTDGAAAEALVARWKGVAAAGVAAGQAGGWVRSEGKRAGTLDKRALQGVVARAFGDDPPRTPASATYPAGQVKIDRDTLQDAADRVAKATPADAAPLVAYAESLLAAKYLSVWGTPLLAGALHPLTSSPLHLVATGRTGWANPPLQQPPRSGGVRECFVARPGTVFVSVDYEIAELCALAQVLLWTGCGRELADAINSGADVHCLTAAEITGRPADEIRAGYLAGDAHATASRQLAKVANFGFPGGLGAPRFAEYAQHQGVEIDTHRAHEVRAAWLRAWPSMGSYFALIGRLLGDRPSMVVQHPVSGRVRGGVGYTDGCNGFFQGLVADGAKAALWDVTVAGYRPDGPMAGVRPVLFLHDEIIAEVPRPPGREGEVAASAAADAIAATMVAAMRRHTPDVVARAEPAMMTRWYKKAKPVHDAEGVLVPWTPN